MRLQRNLVLRIWLAMSGALLFFPAMTFANLAWSSVVLEKTADLKADHLTFVFPFKNTGDQAISITTVRPLCSCTSALADRQTYKAGQEGKVTAVFTVGQNTGPQEKFIDVKTSDGVTQRLTFKVALPQMATLVPNHLMWLVDKPLTPQTTDFIVVQADPVNVLSATSSTKGFKVELITLKKGFRYQLKVTPTYLTPVKAVIAIRTDYPVGKPREFDALAEIWNRQ